MNFYLNVLVLIAVVLLFGCIEVPDPPTDAQPPTPDADDQKDATPCAVDTGDLVFDCFSGCLRDTLCPEDQQPNADVELCAIECIRGEHQGNWCPP